MEGNDRTPLHQPTYFTNNRNVGVAGEPVTVADEIKTGTLFAGKYRIERHVGKGGMSTVYEATNLVLQLRVALKVMSDDLATVPEAVERFVREGVATSRVRHKAIVQVFDAGEHQGTPWIAMEFLDGESLNERFASEGPLPPAEVMRIANEIAGGLGAAHDHGVVHRDLKPHNIYLDCTQNPPQPKILDFGIAKLSDVGMAKLTQTGLMMGTPHYMSPEQAHGSKDIGPQADFWSLGVIMLEGLSGKMPYEAESVAGYLGKLVTAKPRGVQELAPSTPADVAKVVMWCLELEPGARPADSKTLIAELERVSRELEQSPTDRGPVSVPRATEPSLIAMTLVKPDEPSVPEAQDSAHFNNVRTDNSFVQSTDGALTGKPGVLPTPAEVGSTFVALAPSTSRKELRRIGRPLIIVTVVMVALLGTVGVIAASFVLTRAYCVDESPQTAETTPDVAPPAKAAPPAQLPAPAPTPPPAIPTSPPPPSGDTSTRQPLPTLQAGSVSIDSDPRGAKIILNGYDIGQITPTSIPLDKTAHIEVRLDGYLSSSKLFRPGQPSLFFRLEKAGNKGTSKAVGAPGKGFDDWAKHWQQQQEQNR